jgi:hypothetical protein
VRTIKHCGPTSELTIYITEQKIHKDCKWNTGGAMITRSSYPYTKYVRSKNQNDMNRNDHSNFKIFRRGQEQGWKVGRVYVHRHQYVQLI